MALKNRKFAVLSAVLLALSFLNIVSAQETPVLEEELTSKIDKEKIFSDVEKDAARNYPRYYQVDQASVKTVLKEVKEDENALSPELKDAAQNIQNVQNTLVTIEKVINIAMKIWDIVKDNAPVVNIENKYAVAYPEGITAASQLTNWKKPRVYVYGFYANNLYGGRVIDVEYRVIFNYNGDYKGKGKFLTGVSVVPTKVDVVWGYRLNMSSFVPDSTVVNVATSENPLAALQLKLTCKISTYLKDSTNSSVYYIQGDGYFSEIASPFKDQEKGLKKTFIAPLIEGKVSEEKIFGL